MARDPEGAELDHADREMLDYALKLSIRPETIRDTDIDRLRTHGFDDTAILDICQITAYFNYVNRLADGLGVELEETWAEAEMTLDREEFEHIVSGKRVTP